MDASLNALRNSSLSSVLASCEPELQELMRQIDIMINHQKAEWQAEVRALELRARSGQDELSTTKETLQRRDLEIEVLRKQLEDAQTDRQELVSKYEVQLQRVKEQLDKLKRSYQKLQLKKLNVEQQQTSHQKPLEADNGTRTQKQPPPEEQQDDSVRRTRLEEQRLYDEAARLALRAKERGVRSAEEHLSGRGCAEMEALRKELERTAAQLHAARAQEAHLRAELSCLTQRLENTSGPHADPTKLEQELESLKSELGSSAAEVKKLREELEEARQSHGGQVEGMRREVSKLSGELQRRDLSIAALSGSSSSLKQRLQSEAARAELTAAELKTTRAQLETLQSEHHRLLHGVHGSCSKETSCVTGLLQERPTGMQVGPAPPEESRERYERARLSHADSERPSPGQDSLQEGENAARCGGGIQRLFKELRILGQAPTEQESSACSSSSCSLRLTRRSSGPSSGPSSSPDESSAEASSAKELQTSRQRERRIPPPSLEEASTNSSVTRFLQDESLRSEELLQKLDSHIQGMRDHNARTVSKYVPNGAASKTDQADQP